MDVFSLVSRLQQHDLQALARCISIVENEGEGHEQVLQSLVFSHHTQIIGITGPPGAGKSTLVNALLKKFLERKKKVAVIAVDPSSPFNFGALLGDRIRMSEHFNDPGIFIRSLASRGSLGGLSEKIIEVTDVIRAAGFDYIFIETVGVGQSEVEIAGLADTTVVVLVPESGDEIQTMKAGLMEIADIFVVNKADRADAGHFANNLKILLHSKSEEQIPVIKTIAPSDAGINELADAIQTHKASPRASEKKIFLLARKAWNLIQRQRMRDIEMEELREEIATEIKKGKFNLYGFVKKYFL